MPGFGTAAQAGSTRTPLQVQLAVWRALFLREAASRLSATRTAWLWLLLEPVAHVAFLVLVFSVFRQRAMAGVDFAIFLALGVLGFQMFKNAAQRPMTAIGANQALFTYRQVKPVDTVLSRAFLEGLLQLLVTAILLCFVWLVGFDIAPHDPLLMGAALLALWSLGLGFSLVFSVAAGLIPEIGRLVGMMFQPLYFLSGIFFRPELLPPGLREWMMLNPVLNGIEVLRGATFASYGVYPDVSLGYVGVWALCLVFLGLALHLAFAQRLASQ